MNVVEDVLQFFFACIQLRGYQIPTFDLSFEVDGQSTLQQEILIEGIISGQRLDTARYIVTRRRDVCQRGDEHVASGYVDLERVMLRVATGVGQLDCEFVFSDRQEVLDRELVASVHGELIAVDRQPVAAANCLAEETHSASCYGDVLARQIGLSVYGSRRSHERRFLLCPLAIVGRSPAHAVEGRQAFRKRERLRLGLISLTAFPDRVQYIGQLAVARRERRLLPHECRETARIGPQYHERLDAIDIRLAIDMQLHRLHVRRIVGVGGEDDRFDRTTADQINGTRSPYREARIEDGRVLGRPNHASLRKMHGETSVHNRTSVVLLFFGDSCNRLTKSFDYQASAPATFAN